MILFKPEHIRPILEGRKTQTRRLGSKRWNVGVRHQCRTAMLDRYSTFALAEILEVRQEPVMACSLEDARAEGYDSVMSFLMAFERINGIDLTDDGSLHTPVVWVVRFRFVPRPDPGYGDLEADYPGEHKRPDCPADWVHIDSTPGGTWRQVCGGCGARRWVGK